MKLKVGDQNDRKLSVREDNDKTGMQEAALKRTGVR
jgi:hypothetical protein